MMLGHKHIYTTLKHKYFVWVASKRVGKIPFWQVLIHDLSKFSPSEFPAYHYHFHVAKDRGRDFAYAWLHHQRHNPHHWEYWVICAGNITRRESGAVDGVMEMPERYVREMVADWMAASRTHQGSWDISKWVNRNLPKIRLHPKSRELLLEVLEDVGVDLDKKYKEKT